MYKAQRLPGSPRQVTRAAGRSAERCSFASCSSPTASVIPRRLLGEAVVHVRAPPPCHRRLPWKPPPPEPPAQSAPQWISDAVATPVERETRWGGQVD